MRPVDHHTVFARKLCSTLQDVRFKRGFDVLGRICLVRLIDIRSSKLLVLTRIREGES